MRHLDLFSGIGGFALAARWVGWETVGFCEIDTYCQKVLRKHWPEVSIHDDIKTYKGTAGFADVVTGGFPCQDISIAGKGRGIKQGTRSGLWSEQCRIISEVEPGFAIVENVTELLNRGMGRVLGDLSEIGYDCEWETISASMLGSNHQRERTFILAYPRGKRRQRYIPEAFPEQPAFSWCKDGRRIEDLPDSCDLYESKLCRSANGISQELGAYGNAIVPQVAEVIFRAINETVGSRG